MINRHISKLWRKAENEKAKDGGNNPFRNRAYHMIVPAAIRGIPKKLKRNVLSITQSSSPVPVP